MDAKESGLEIVVAALDTSDREEFRRWCALFGPRVGVLKIGLELFCRFGPTIVEEARAEAAQIFLDLKLHDIPTTVARAVAAVRDLDVDYVTVHAAGGSAMLEAAVEAAGSVRVLAVTVLTSLDAEALARLDLGSAVGERVERWARLAQKAGAAGVVCSPGELERLRGALPRPFLLVAPGVRPAGVGSDDQRRTATPRATLSAGADLLVIGRPLTRSRDPRAALARLAAELGELGGSVKR